MTNSRLDKLLKMLENQPDDPFLLYAVGFEHESAGENDKALDCYSVVLDRHPDYLPVYYQAGLLEATMGRLPKAKDLLEKGIAIAKKQNDRKTENELRQALEDVED